MHRFSFNALLFVVRVTGSMHVPTIRIVWCAIRHVFRVVVFFAENALTIVRPATRSQ